MVNAHVIAVPCLSLDIPNLFCQMLSRFISFIWKITIVLSHKHLCCYLIRSRCFISHLSWNQQENARGIHLPLCPRQKRQTHEACHSDLRYEVTWISKTVERLKVNFLEPLHPPSQEDMTKKWNVGWVVLVKWMKSYLDPQIQFTSTYQKDSTQIEVFPLENDYFDVIY